MFHNIIHMPPWTNIWNPLRVPLGQLSSYPHWTHLLYMCNPLDIYLGPLLDAIIIVYTFIPLGLIHTAPTGHMYHTMHSIQKPPWTNIWNTEL